VVDIFRLENGKNAEHWDVVQEEIPTSKSANGNAMTSFK
jgi:predicted SnoaL-like aldol condensation-catalyzing enzyme